MKRLVFAAASVLVTSLFFSCATLDSLKEKVSEIFGSQSADSSESSFLDASKKSGETKILSSSYTRPESYDTAYSYRTDTPYKNIQTLLKDKNLESLRTTNPASYVKTACEAISVSTQNDFEKVKMAHDFICLLISYDAANFWANTVPAQDFASVLKSKKAVCEGYSNTFKKFCDTLGISCEKISGYARGVGISLLTETSPSSSNHAWNIVKLEGAWYVIDCTWDSGHMEGKVSKQDYTTDYLFLRPEHFIYTHYPSDSRKQLLEKPVSANQFTALPNLTPKFFEVTEKQSKVSKINEAENSYQLEYKPKNGYELNFRVSNAQTGTVYQNNSFVKILEDKNLALFSFPKADTYLVTIFWKKTGTTKSKSCGEFLVKTTSESSVLYPVVYSSSAKNVRIVSPVEMSLKKGETYTFSVFVENKRFVAAICGKNFIQLENDGTGLFSGEVTIPSNIKELTLSASNSERTSYEGLAKYSVE